MEVGGRREIKKEPSASSPSNPEEVEEIQSPEETPSCSTPPSPPSGGGVSKVWVSNPGDPCKLEEEEDSQSLSSLLIPGEDGDDDEFLNPFPLIPKIELDPEEENWGPANPSEQPTQTHPSPLCLLCSKTARPWPKPTKRKPSLLTSNLCNLFDIGLEEVRGGVGRKGYCRPCQGLLNDLTDLYAQLHNIRRKVGAVKTELEAKVMRSVCPSEPQLIRHTRNKGRRAPGQNNQKTVQAILAQRVTFSTDGPPVQASVGQSDAYKNLSSVASSVVDSLRGNGDPPEDADEPKLEDDPAYSSPPPSPEVDWHEISSPDQTEEEDNSELDTRKARVSSKRRGWTKSAKEVRGPYKKKPKVEKDGGRTSTEDESQPRVLRNRRTSSYFPVKKKRERIERKKESRQEKTVKCDLCQKMFPDDVRKNAHIRGFHEGIKDNYFCDFPDCTKHYRCLTVLENHKMSHTGETPFVCESCGKSYKLKIQLQNHQRNIHFPDGRSFKCDQCDKRYLYRSGLESHKKTHDPVREHPFICEVCGQGYYTLQALNAHRRVKHSEENPFICRQDKCGKVFSSKLALKEHHYTHTKEWPFYCSICGVGSVSQSRLDRHLKRKHGETFECELCHKKMAYKESLKKHMMIHSDGKKFECDQCGKRFLDNYRLKVHQSLHVGDRIYQCDICSKRFINKPYLRRHIKNSHRKTYYQQIKDRKRQSQHLGFIDLNNSQEDEEGSSGGSSAEDRSESKDTSQGKTTIPQLLATANPPSSAPLDSATPTHHHSINMGNTGGGFLDPRPHPLLPNPSSNLSHLPHQPIYHQAYSSAGNPLGMQPPPHSFLNFHHL